GPCSMLSSCSPNSIGPNASREPAADSRRNETALHLDPQGAGEGLLSAVRERGLEPLRPKTLEPKSSASTNSATRARRASGPAATPSRLAGGERDAENHAAGAGAGQGRWRIGPLGDGPGRSGRVDAQSLAHAGDVAGGLDVVLGELDLAFGVDDDRRADDALDDLPVVLLLAEGTPFFHHRPVLIGEQIEVQALLLDELLQLLRLVRGDAEDDESGRLQCRERVPEVAGLGRAARCHGRGVEVDDDALALEIAEADRVPVLVDECEVRGGVAD